MATQLDQLNQAIKDTQDSVSALEARVAKLQPQDLAGAIAGVQAIKTSLDAITTLPVPLTGGTVTNV